MSTTDHERVRGRVPNRITARTPTRRTPTTARRSTAAKPAASVAPAARWPFAALLAVLAATGIIVLLMINTATAETSFTLKKKQTELDVLIQQQQSLQKKVSAKEAPEVLAKKAAELGMVPGPQPGYFVLNPDGTYTFVEAPQQPPAPAVAAPPAPAAAATTTAPATQTSPITPPADQ